MLKSPLATLVIGLMLGLALGYALADFGLAFLRGDGTWRVGLWLSQWAAVAEMCVAVALGVYVLTRSDKRPSKEATRRTSRPSWHRRDHPAIQNL